MKMPTIGIVVDAMGNRRGRAQCGIAIRPRSAIPAAMIAKNIVPTPRTTANGQRHKFRTVLGCMASFALAGRMTRHAGSVKASWPAPRFPRHVSPLTTDVYTHPNDEDMQTRLKRLCC